MEDNRAIDKNRLHRFEEETLDRMVQRKLDREYSQKSNPENIEEIFAADSPRRKKEYCFQGTIADVVHTGDTMSYIMVGRYERVFSVQTNGFTVMSGTEFEKEDQVYVIASGAPGDYTASLICSRELFPRFAAIEKTKDMKECLKEYNNLTPELRKQIDRAANGAISDETDSCTEYFLSAKELKTKYHLCRNSYTAAQRRCIEKLLPSVKHGSDGKTIKQLRYLLNITSEAAKVRSLTREQILEQLNHKVYGMQHVKECIADTLAASKRAEKRGTRILLVGNPGLGKSLIAKVIAEMFGIPYDTLYLNSIASGVELKGIDPIFSDANAGSIVRAFYRAQTTEMVLVLEELDKLQKTSKDGPPQAALLEVLSDRYEIADSFVGAPISTENTIFIATANSTRTIIPELLDRFEVIRIEDYTDEEMLTIAKDYILPELMSQYRIPNRSMRWENEAIMEVIQNYCVESGVRQLKDHMKLIIRKVAAMWGDEKIPVIKITPDMVRKVLGPYVDSKNLRLQYNRNKDKYAPTVREEIRRTLSRISVECDSHEALVEERRANYLISLVPENSGFADFDAAYFRKTVEHSHYGMEEVKERIAKEFFVQHLKKGNFSAERMLLVGGPGYGKTSICKSIAKGLNMPLVKVSLNGMSDPKILKGFPPTYEGAEAGSIIKGLANAKTTRAVVMLDEIDKMGTQDGVRASSALLDLLDGSNQFCDYFLTVPVDLSNVLFIATANDLSNLEPWLLDRFQVIELDGYTREDKKKILSQCFFPKLEKEFSESDLNISITEEAETLLVKEYAVSFGVRDLEKQVRKIIIDLLYEGRNARNLIIRPEDVRKSLGAKPFPRGNLPEHRHPGYAKALAVSGGNMGLAFAVESSVVPNDSSVCITGLPRESTVDSVRLAQTYLRLHYFEHQDPVGFHLHFGEGAVVKDGPSAGTAILISMLSAYWNQELNGDYAFTGEIDLYGYVYAVGGICEKIMAAMKSGCTRVYIPEENAARLTLKEKERFEGIEIVPVRHVDTIIREVFDREQAKNCIVSEQRHTDAA